MLQDPSILRIKDFLSNIFLFQSLMHAAAKKIYFQYMISLLGSKESNSELTGLHLFLWFQHICHPPKNNMYGELLSFCFFFFFSFRNKHYWKLKVRFNTDKFRILFFCLNDKGKGKSSRNQEEKLWRASPSILTYEEAEVLKGRPADSIPHWREWRTQDF